MPPAPPASTSSLRVEPPSPSACLRAAGAAACVLTVVVQPNARKTEAIGVLEGALRIRLAAQPIEGQANTVLTAWLAQELRLAKRAVRLRRGTAARHKQIEIDAPLSDVQAWLKRTLGEAPGAA
jgi:uncharacterized protein